MATRVWKVQRNDGRVFVLVLGSKFIVCVHVVYACVCVCVCVCVCI